MSVAKLRPGEKYLRETSVTWKKEIVKSMKNNPFVNGTPLFAIADCTKDEFDRGRVSFTLHVYVPASKENIHKFLIDGK